MQSFIDGSVGHSHLLGEIEARQAEIKKDINRIQRFGNAGLRTHIQREPVQHAMKLLQPAQLFMVLQNAGQALNGASIPAADVTSGEVPHLMRTPFACSPAEPVSPQPRQRADDVSSVLQTASARLLELLGKVAQLSSNASLSNLVNQLRSYNAMMTGSSTRYGELANQLEQQAALWAEAHDALTLAQTRVTTVQQDVERAALALHEVQVSLQKLMTQAASEQETMGEISPALQKRLTQAEQKAMQAQRTVDTATSAYNDAQRNHLAPAIEAEKQYKAQLQETQQQAQRVAAGYSAPQVSVIEAKRTTSNDESKSLAYLMAVIAQLIGESASEDMQASAALKQKLAEAAAKDAEKRGKEYEEQVRKAEDMQRTMGCVGKTIGWVITGVSVIGALFTGGASLALAGIGLALAVGDEIYHAVTGRSYLQEALQPIMEKVIQPLIELLAKYYSAILIFMGVDKKTAEGYGMVLGAIAASVLLIAGAIVAGKVMSKMAGMLIESLGASTVMQASKEMMRSMLKKTVDSSVGQFFKRTSSTLGRRLNVSETTLFRINAMTRGAQSVGSLSGSIIGTVGAVSVANMQIDAEKARSRLLNNMALQEILNEMMERMMETFSHRLEGVNAIIENMAAVAENQLKAGQYITRKMRAVAG